LHIAAARIAAVPRAIISFFGENSDNLRRLLHFLELHVMSVAELDRTDIKILNVLQQEGALSAAQVGERVGVTAPTAWRRITRLEKAGVILGRHATLDLKKVGLGLIVFVRVKLVNGGRDSLAAFSRAIHKLPEVVDCYTITGDVNFLLRVVTSDTVAYDAFFLDHLSALPGILSTESSIALSTIKSTQVLPLLPTKRQ
jgi:Lrp/AsnC family transcriptional regulator